MTISPAEIRELAVTSQETAGACGFVGLPALRLRVVGGNLVSDLRYWCSLGFEFQGLLYMEASHSMLYNGTCISVVAQVTKNILT